MKSSPPMTNNIMDKAIDPVVIKKLKSLIRNVPDFPKPGIVFRDITPLLADPEGLKLSYEILAQPYHQEHVDLIVGAESRGFLFGVGVARELDCGFIPVRKPGKLPARTISQEYELEYGTDKLEMHADAIKPHQRIVLVDDLLATGGTMQACCQMVRQLGGEIVGISFLVELSFLKGRDVLGDYPVYSIINYETE